MPSVPKKHSGTNGLITYEHSMNRSHSQIQPAPSTSDNSAHRAPRPQSPVKLTSPLDPPQTHHRLNIRITTRPPPEYHQTHHQTTTRIPPDPPPDHHQTPNIFYIHAQFPPITRTGSFDLTCHSHRPYSPSGIPPPHHRGPMKSGSTDAYRSLELRASLWSWIRWPCTAATGPLGRYSPTRSTRPAIYIWCASPSKRLSRKQQSNI